MTPVPRGICDARYVTSRRQICFGAGVTLKNHRTAGAYLHSHPHLYPPEAGPVQQQITTYSHKDYNNIW